MPGKEAPIRGLDDVSPWTVPPLPVLVDGTWTTQSVAHIPTTRPLDNPKRVAHTGLDNSCGVTHTDHSLRLIGFFIVSQEKEQWKKLGYSKEAVKEKKGEARGEKDEEGEKEGGEGPRTIPNPSTLKPLNICLDNGVHFRERGCR